MHHDRLLLLTLVVILVVFCIQPTAGEPELVNNISGVLIPANDLILNQTEAVTGTDILSLINKSREVKAPSSVNLLHVQPGATYTSDEPESVPVVLYMLAGAANISTDNASLSLTTNDTVIIPAESRFRVTNSGSEPLQFFSVTSLPISGNTSHLTRMDWKTPADVTPVVLGNVSDNTGFSIERMVDTNGDGLPLSFDLAVASLPSGNIIDSHYLTSGQLYYVLSGTGMVSMGCSPHEIERGDLFYIPPTMVQKIQAKTDMRLLLLTDPYYQAEQDYPAVDHC